MILQTTILSRRGSFVLYLTVARSRFAAVVSKTYVLFSRRTKKVEKRIAQRHRRNVFIEGTRSERGKDAMHLREFGRLNRTVDAVSIGLSQETCTDATLRIGEAESFAKERRSPEESLFVESQNPWQFLSGLGIGRRDITKSGSRNGGREVQDTDRAKRRRNSIRSVQWITYERMINRIGMSFGFCVVASAERKRRRNEEEEGGAASAKPTWWRGPRETIVTVDAARVR